MSLSWKWLEIANKWQRSNIYTYFVLSRYQIMVTVEKASMLDEPLVWPSSMSLCPCVFYILLVLSLYRVTNQGVTAILWKYNLSLQKAVSSHSQGLYLKQKNRKDQNVINVLQWRTTSQSLRPKRKHQIQKPTNSRDPYTFSACLSSHCSQRRAGV